MKLHQQTCLVSPLRDAIHQHYRCDETALLETLLPLAQLPGDGHHRVRKTAMEFAEAVRNDAQNGSSIQNLLNEYTLSTQEGIVLMCLAEALLRVPDSTTADRLIRDKLVPGDWSSHIGNSDSLFVNSSAWGLLVSGRVVSFNEEEKRRQIGRLKKVIGKMGEPIIRQAMRQAMAIMGTQFVLGQTIEEASKRAEKLEAKGYRYSYDMLGEAARTMSDADAYYTSYEKAIHHIGKLATGKGIYQGAGISVKLSAIHPRYEFVKSERLMLELVPRLRNLARLAKQYNIGMTIDAEEAERLDISLDIIETVFSDPQLAGWEGFGVVVQAYQKRALYVLNWLIDLSQRTGKKMMLRLVKGAYWDSEIKIAQVNGLDDYPVFTRKASTDVSYQACASVLLDNRASIFPQFATHNAYTMAYILERAGGDLRGFECQRLHGMGAGLYDRLAEETNVPVRIYAPVGEHKSLLAYLVRRLLENGANTSFVNNIVNQSIPLASLIEDPVSKVRSWPRKNNPNIPLPSALYGDSRTNSQGVDVTDMPHMSILAENIRSWVTANLRGGSTASQNQLASISPTNTKKVLGYVSRTSAPELSEKLDIALAAHRNWSQVSIDERCACLLRLADKLEQQLPAFLALCTLEAGKVTLDGVAEVREAVDFCRYYANEGRKVMGIHRDWGCNGQLQSRGVVLCISPWNFPLAIFLGQVTAALAAGNSVLAKPADSTCLIASLAIQLMAGCGFPENLVQLIITPGQAVGEHLLPDPRVSAVMFTGSTEVGAGIARTLAQRAGSRIPLIAETGGQNCMIVDSTTLPEQVVDDVISSGFQSAGQRCSALRVLFLQEDVAVGIIDMIIGAMQELHVGNPEILHTDVGPVIDEKALSALQSHAEFMQTNGSLLYQCPLSAECKNGTFFAPRLYEIDNISLLRQEVFGPVVHIVRYQAKALDQVLADINSTGFGLTCGIHSRIQTTAEKVISSINAGNIYVNRNIIGAVVGVQPFGGHGLSGTGPKAGGPSYVYRLAKQATNDEPQSIDNVDFSGAHANYNDAVKPGIAKAQSNIIWQRVAAEQRCELILQFSSSLGNTHPNRFPEELKAQLAVMISETIATQSKPQTLPGPTGELNQLKLLPRGSLLCIQQAGVHALDSLRQILAALLGGNTVVHVSSEVFDYSEIMNSTGLGTVYSRATTTSKRELKTLLAAKPLKGVAVSGSESLHRWLDQTLSQRQGALLPLIIETNGPALLRRFLLEKSVSNDTTAAGGNASLLTMGDN